MPPAASQEILTREKVLDCVMSAAYGNRLVTNVLRGLVTESIIANTLPAEWTWCAADYGSCDFQHRDGTKLEVKQSAALQTWNRASARISKPSFDIAQRKGLWEGGTVWIPGQRRNADMYVFALHPVTDETADHCEPGQWQFYVVAETMLPLTKRLSLKVLEQLAPPRTVFELSEAVTSVQATIILSRREQNPGQALLV